MYLVDEYDYFLPLFSNGGCYRIDYVHCLIARNSLTLFIWLTLTPELASALMVHRTFFIVDFLGWRPGSANPLTSYTTTTPNLTLPVGSRKLAIAMLYTLAM